MKYLSQRFNENPVEQGYFPAILNYNYAATIRPRGELMLKVGRILPWKDVLPLDDEEFCNLLAVGLDVSSEIFC
jgi:hypothetical protein